MDRIGKRTIRVTLILLVLASAIFSFRPLVIHGFNQIYLASHITRRTRWFGVPALQAPTDMWSMQEIITEVKPDYIVETGTYLGGSALFFATVLEHVHPRGKVITVDIQDFRRKGYDASRFATFRERVEFIQGSSLSPQVVARIAAKVRGHRVMVFLDSGHRREHVLRELKLYSPLVSVGSYIIVHDTNRGPPSFLNRGWFGPFGAVRVFLKKHKNFIADRSREKFLLTYSPSGYLKRIA